MPRKARKDVTMPFLHIMIQGINKEYIFNDKYEVTKYLELLEKNYKKFNLKIIAYCIMNNHVHLLIHTEEINNLSEFMRCVNTSYGMYYNKKNNRCGYVFRNRYKVEEIYTKKHLLSCINYIHNNPVKAKMCNEKKDYKYSSYNDYIKKEKFINDEVINNYLVNNGINYNDVVRADFMCHDFIEYKNKKERNADKDKVISDYIKKNNINLENILKNKEMLKDLVKLLYKECDVTQSDIANRLGTSRIKIQRILSS